MPSVDIFKDEDEAQPLLSADFDFLPRKGEYLMLDVDEETLQCEIVDVWYAQGEEDETFHACIRVELEG